jgi:hypothetical protein
MVHEQREAAQQGESLSPDVVTFCSLIARIVMRCLRQHDTRLERFLFLPAQSEEQQRGSTHDPTTESQRSSHTSSALRQELPAQAAGRDRRANLEKCTRRGLLPAVFYEDDDCSARRAGRLASRHQAAPGGCRGEAAHGGVRPHARPSKGECR